ncbi:aspartyl protease family protein [Halobaculum sp. MBLA0147]|uniref:aspartyl protease family protein n=1 Tax=Halobaculum sp. MBLA0147 TaxID=3079934 RepID=UPI003523DE8D
MGRPASHEHDTDDVRVGVVSFHNSKETKAICNAVADLGHTPVWFGRSNLASRVAGGAASVEPPVDVAINRLLTTKATRPLCQLSLAGVVADAVPTLNHPDTVAAMLHKYRAAARLARAGVPVPDTVLSPRRTPPDDWAATVGDTAVRKPGIGTNGTGVDRVERDDVVTHHETGYLIQRFHPSRGARHSDVRVYVVDGTVVGAMRRVAPADEWRSNVALGGETEDVTDTLSESARRIAVRATEVLDLDTAGVDLVQQVPVGDRQPVAPYEDTTRTAGEPVASDTSTLSSGDTPSGGASETESGSRAGADTREETSDWAVLEVNATAGFKGLFDATGVSAAPYLAAAAVERVGGTVDTDRVHRLADELDDSLPDCAPDDVLVSDDGVAGTVGYTASVAVAGVEGATEETAKVDTGADRTTVDFEVAEAVGAGPISGTTTVRAGDGTSTRPVVPISVRIGRDWFDVTAGLADRSANRHPVLLGRDVLERFRIDPRAGPNSDPGDGQATSFEE